MVTTLPHPTLSFYLQQVATFNSTGSSCSLCQHRHYYGVLTVLPILTPTTTTTSCPYLLHHIAHVFTYSQYLHLQELLLLLQLGQPGLLPKNPRNLHVAGSGNITHSYQNVWWLRGTWYEWPVLIVLHCFVRMLVSLAIHAVCTLYLWFSLFLYWSAARPKDMYVCLCSIFPTPKSPSPFLPRISFVCLVLLLTLCL